jgi:protein TonB
VRWLLIVVLAFVVNAVFFLAIPVANVLLAGRPAPQKAETPAQEIEVLARRPKPEVPKQVVRQIRQVNHFEMNAGARTNQAALKGFAMDLSLAGEGEGVAVGGGGMGNVVYEAGEVDEEAQELRKVLPKYPERARKHRVSGVVKVFLVIDPEGKVSEASVMSVNPPGYGFETEALAAIRQFQFVPAQVGGYPVSQKATKEFNFTL